MNENLNLVEILKDCPSGTKLYSTVYGDVELCEVNIDYNHPIRVWCNGGPDCFTKILVDFTKDGKIFCGSYGECVLFPSKDQRDWSKLKPKQTKFNPKFKVGDMIRHKKTNKNDVYEISKVSDDYYGIAGFPWMICMEYQDQYESVPNKFDPKTLKPFDKVVVSNEDSKWKCGLFSHIIDSASKYKYSCIGSAYVYCIPYNEDTKHLVGTTKEVPDFYRYWED